MTAETRWTGGKSPPVNYHTQGVTGLGTGAILLHSSKQIWELFADGTPTNGTAGTGAGWASIGSRFTDQVAGKLYINTGTMLSPTWTVVGSQS